MLIAITGANGGLGQAIHALLLEDPQHRVRCIDLSTGSRAAPELLLCDLNHYDETIAALRGVDAVIHCAAIPGPFLKPDWQVHNNNVTSSYNVLRAAAELSISRVTQISSSNAIGSAFNSGRRTYTVLPLDETVECLPEDPYSLSKLICEVQASSLVRTFPNLRIATLRPWLCFAAQPSSENAFGDQWSAIGEHVGGKQVANDCWSYTMVEDIARAAILGVTSEGWEGHEIFWIASPVTRVAAEGGSHTTAELVRVYHPAAKLRDGWVNDMPFRGLVDCSKAERLLGWRAVYAPN